MSTPTASYGFLPWMRRGISTHAREDASGAGRLTVPIAVSFSAGRQASVALKLVSPGEVVGLDPRTVIRASPPANVYDAEPNYFPMVEFGEPDLPWRYTPAPAPTDERLPPWLCLIVLTDDEIGGIVPPSGARPLSIVTVVDAPLPRLDQSWAWAHAQVAGAQNIQPPETGALLSEEPHLLVSRLLCPRRLDAGTRYTAFLVPAFESGVRAGLGTPSNEPADPIEPAWSPDRDRHSLQLPVYYRWSFTTGLVGDFEDLVRRLEPRELPPTVGIRGMDVSAPGAQLPSAAEGPLGLEGALRAPTTESTGWPEAERQPFVEALVRFVNLPADLLEAPDDGVRAVAPPLYGRWYTARDRLAPAGEPGWFEEANTDPRWRVVAGLGTLVVQANQRQLMASAWRQAEGLSDVNDALRRTQFSREIALRMHARHLALDDDELLLQVTAPVHQRVLASPVTIAARLRESPIAEGGVGSGWRRVARPLGPVGRRQARQPGERPRVVSRMNRAKLSPAPRPPTATGMVTPSRAGQALVPAWAGSAAPARLRAFARRLRPAGGAGLGLAGVLRLLGVSIGSTAATGVASVAALLSAGPLRRLADGLERRTAVRDGTLTPQAVEGVPARPRFVATESPLLGRELARPATARRGEDSPSARAFRTGAAAALAPATSAIADATPPRPVALDEFRKKLVEELDPHKTIGTSMRDRLHVADRVRWLPTDPLEPVLTGPEFPQPMYRHLADLSQDWLLPGIEQVPDNTVSLVVTNQRFVEAFMLGLNHEMGRELLWREFETDQRRTYFRQFWDPSGFVPRPGQTLDVDALQDIRPIHRWAGSAGLGENGSRDSETRENLVLLVRGDVVHRYPNLVVYAARATVDDATGEREPGPEEQQLVFGGVLDPDIAFVGFSLTEADVRGGDDDEGWFFVLEEQLTEPRFGLDLGDPGDESPASWNDLHWGHLVAPGEELSTVDYIDLDAELPDTTEIGEPPDVAWHADSGSGPRGTNAAQLAFITLQRPVRVAIHAADILSS